MFDNGVIGTVSSDRRKSFWPVYNFVSALEFVDPPRARHVFDDLLAEGLDDYSAPADLWHNASMVAARVQHQVAELALIQAGIREWPYDVDLLCDEFQLRYSSHSDAARAQEIWERLIALDKSITAPQWRFWVYGAIYLGVQLGDRVTALRLLDQGLCSVKRDAVMDVLRAYRRILVDTPPERPLTGPSDVAEYHAEILTHLEERLKLGLHLGVENAYVLAAELAVLYQERGGHLQTSGETGVNSTALPQEDEYLLQAWKYLDLAERLYTGNRNHPIWEIYEKRIWILMAQHRYGDALKVLSSLPKSRFSSNPSLSTMMKLASLMTGERIAELVDISTTEGMEQALQKLLEGDGDLFLNIVRQNAALQPILKSVLGKAGLAGDRKEMSVQDAVELAIPYLFGNDGELLRTLIEHNPSLRSVIANIANQPG